MEDLQSVGRHRSTLRTSKESSSPATACAGILIRPTAPEASAVTASRGRIARLSQLPDHRPRGRRNILYNVSVKINTSIANDKWSGTLASTRKFQIAPICLCIYCTCKDTICLFACLFVIEWLESLRTRAVV